MSPVKPVFDPANLYFITTSAVSRTKLFHPNENKNILVGSLNYMRQEGWFKLYAFVIMPNHIHLLARFVKPHNLADVMRDFKKFTAKKIAQQIIISDDQHMLSIIKSVGGKSGKNQYKVWEDGYDARDVFSQGFLEQKLDYIHSNPCQLQWRLVEQPADYQWSSASYYLEGRPTIIAIDDVREYLVG
jgi:putative transposase